VRKILLLNSKQLLRKLQKILGGYFFAAPCRCPVFDRTCCSPFFGDLL